MSEIAIIISSRMGSSRFPGKAMADIGGQPMLARVIQRCRQTGLPVVVATSTKPENDVIGRLCRSMGCPVYRGSEEDVLGRINMCIMHGMADVTHVIRVTGDCPLVDPGLITLTAHLFFLHPHAVYASNTHPVPMYPKGLDVEMFTVSLLRHVNDVATEAQDREHVTRYIRHRLSSFETFSVKSPADLSHLNWCVDTPDQVAFPRRIYATLGEKFSWIDVLTLEGI